MFAKEITAIMPTAKTAVQMCACGSKAVRYDTIFNVNAQSALSTLNQHVTDVVRACTQCTHALRHIRPVLTVDPAQPIASAIVGAVLHVEYSNSFILGTSE